MEPTQLAVLLLIGLFTGVVSSLMGVGGGIVVVPLLTLFYGMTQKNASATSLAMLLPPIGIFAVMEYHQKGMIDLKVAAVLALPFAVGALLGARYLMPLIPDATLKVIFSALMIYAAVMLLLKAAPRERAVLAALVAAGLWFAAYHGLRLLGKRWDRTRPSAAEIYRTHTTP